MLKVGRVGAGFSPYINQQNYSAFRPWGMLFLFVPAKNRTSGPKGRKDDNVYAGDKSPAYPKTEFFRVFEDPAAGHRFP